MILTTSGTAAIFLIFLSCSSAFTISSVMDTIISHNNKMERLNGEFRDREKVMRGLKRTDSPILKDLQIYHNFVRPHESLNGETPADRAGIKVEGADKFLALIQNASRVQPTATDITQEQGKL